MSDIRRRDLLSSAGAVAAASAMSLTGVAFGGALARTADAGAATTTDLPYRGASELVGALAARQISAAEALEHAISRIEALDSRINAVVVRDFERARRAAAEADAALARGERRPLLGLPMTVKESFNVAGLPTTWGIPAFKGWQPAEDAIAVARLKAAGAVILGKTNLPFALSDWQSYNEIYGTTNNPWDLGRTPGGSSGGSAAALAAGFVPLELGSDISGSIRSPAHFCGVFGHKPSAGLVPLRGHAPPRSEPMETDLAGGLAVAGPLARSAGDLALALAVVAGPDESEATAYRLTLPPSRHDRLSSFRILVIDTHSLLPTAATVRDAINRFAERLARAGARVARDSPLLPDLAQAARLHQKLLAAFTQAFVPLEVYQRIQPIAAKLAGDDDSLAAWRVRGAVLSYRDWIAASAERGRLRRQWRELFREWDVVVCPIMPTPAFPHDHAPDQGSRRLDIDGTQYPYRDQSVWPGIATTPGLPATAAPIDRSEAGLPIGIQIIGPYLEDRTTIGFAELIEREFGGFVAPPAFKA